jgi:hypothetical protein
VGIICRKLLNMSDSNASVSIVCVYNDLAVRQHCLDRSILAADQNPSVEYIPVDNTQGTYASAGAALNYGCSIAKNEVIVFAHQDVYLHSLAAITRVANLTQTQGFAVIGAIGINRMGRIVGYIRDRTVLLGTAVEEPEEVDSVDEVLFMVPRSLVLREKITESPEMAWHAYAVEYGLRMREMGLRVAVANIPLTHNSRTANLTRLDVAHAALASRYTDMLPIQTTCGRIHKRMSSTPGTTWPSSQRWRYGWIRDSFSITQCRKCTYIEAVLADIRIDVDDVLALCPNRRLYVINRLGTELSGHSNFEPLELQRGAGTVVFHACNAAQLPQVLARQPERSWRLVTNLSLDDMLAFNRASLKSVQLLGYWREIGYWVLLGDISASLVPKWRSARATPLAMRLGVSRIISRSSRYFTRGVRGRQSS